MRSTAHLCFLSSPLPPAEEGAFVAPGWRSRVRRVPAAATPHGGSVQTVGEGPPLSGGERGLHHSGVRCVSWTYRCVRQRGLTRADVSSLFCSHLSSVLGSRFDHAAEATMPILLNLVPNSAKVMATSGVAAIRLILRVRVVFESFPADRYLF